MPPTVAVTHAPGEPDERDTIVLTATARDDRQLGVVEVWAQGPGENQPSLLASCSTSPCVGRRQYRSGDLRYVAIARDAAGNETQSAARTVFIRSVPG